ncbi:unnamed protein product [Alopecurus aequalis]
MASLIRTGVRTYKGFKEVHLHACAKALFEHYAAEVTSTRVQPLEEMEVVVDPGSPQGRRVPEQAHSELCSDAGHLLLRASNRKTCHGLRGSPWHAPPEGADTQESDTVLNNGPDKPADAPNYGGKRKRGALGDDEIQAFSSMTEVVKEVDAAIRENKPTDMHSDLYDAVMDVVGFTEEALMLALGHLVDHKAQGVNFIGMAEQHMTL